MQALTAVSQVLLALGGAGLVITALASFLGKLLSAKAIEDVRAEYARSLEREKAEFARNLEGEKANYARELESEKSRLAGQLDELRSSLEIARARSQRVSEARFKVYCDLWNTLQDLRSEADRLWREATGEYVKQFAVALEKARLAIEKGRLVLRDNHYGALDTVFGSFATYELGKKRLVDLRSQEDIANWAESAAPGEIAAQVDRNKSIREDYDRLLTEIVISFREELGLLAA